jgi:hypothetical protein
MRRSFQGIHHAEEIQPLAAYLVGGRQLGSNTVLEFWGNALHLAVRGRVVNRQAVLPRHFFQIAS